MLLCGPIPDLLEPLRLLFVRRSAFAGTLNWARAFEAEPAFARLLCSGWFHIDLAELELLVFGRV